MSEIIILIVVSLGGWLVFDALRARETATIAARDACRAQGLQFLDDTVHGARTRFARDTEGLLRLRRTFSFEFSDDGVFPPPPAPLPGLFSMISTIAGCDPRQAFIPH